MATLGNVQQKMPCVFETKVIQEASSKRAYQPFKVVATESVRKQALTSDVHSACATEKVDGTCVHVKMFQGKPWLWARHDRKPNKAADKQFKKFQITHREWEHSGKAEGAEPMFEWDLEKDLKDLPEDWEPATGVELKDGEPVPDENGHIPGWVPVDPSLRQHLWHLSIVNFHHGLCITLEPSDEGLGLHVRTLAELCGSTLELIGTHVNANPYGLGTKQRPIHCLVRHGIIPVKNIPELKYDSLKEWFQSSPDGAIEGIVWHCADGQLYKLHRHHFGLPWPVAAPALNALQVKVHVDPAMFECPFPESSLFSHLFKLYGRTVPSLKALTDIDQAT